MKNLIISVFTIVLFATQMQGQDRFWNKTALEVSYGYAIPLSPTKNITASDYNSFVNFQAGVNYQIDDLWGVRLTYAYQDFENKNNKNLGVHYNKFMAEATFNVLKAIYRFDSYLSARKFELQLHGGVGGSLAKRKHDKASNNMLNLQVGLKPIVAISKRVNLFLDATYVVNFNQAYEFSGASINGSTTGGYLGVNAGIQVKLGM